MSDAKGDDSSGEGDVVQLGKLVKSIKSKGKVAENIDMLNQVKLELENMVIKESKSGDDSEGNEGDTEDLTEDEDRIDRKFNRLLERIDSRDVPDIGKYEESEGEDLVSYLQKFEKYCKDRFKHGKQYWVTELGKHLSGDALKGFKTVYNFKDSYDCVKKKLIKWHEEESEMIKTRNRSKFEQLKLEEGETNYELSNRMEKVFQQAYPKKSVSYSKTLIRRFENAVNEDLRKFIEDRIMVLGVEDKEITWKMVQKCARVYDLKKGERIQTDYLKSGASSKEIVINLNNSKYVQRQNNNRSNYNRYDKQNKSYTFRNNGENKGNERSRQNDNYRWKRNSNYNCDVCGKTGHASHMCKFRVRTCFACGDKGHMARQCNARRKDVREGKFNPVNSQRENKGTQGHKNENTTEGTEMTETLNYAGRM